MHYQIYLDSLFIQEVIVNFYVLKLCRICLMSTATHKRLILASFFAGVFQTVLFLIPFPENIILFYIVLLSLYMLGSLVTVTIAFGKGDLMVYIKRSVLYMTFLLVMGGIFMGLLPRFSFYNRSEVKAVVFFLSGAAVYVLVWKVFQDKRRDMYCGQFQLGHNGVFVKGKYFMDSGNGLVESISQKPVLLANAEWLFENYPKEELFCRPVLYKSVGKQKGILYAYCMDELVIYGKTKAYTYEKVWVGVCKEDIFANRDYQIILPPFYGVHKE